jgi:choline dehydrogenase-like flavoprotein
MLIDARSLPADEVIETQVCIIGAGPAGITLAREFADRDFQVCLLDSGGFEFDPDVQSLSDGDVIGDPYPEIGTTRHRQFGGTSHTWEGQNGYKEYGFRCLPLDEIDFERREWVPYSGWPFTKAELEPFYERAQQVCQIGPYAYRVEDWADDRAQGLRFSSDRLTTSMSQYAGRYPFTQEYPAQLKQVPNLTILLYATAIELAVDDAHTTVNRIQIAVSPQQRIWLTAKIFIVATGGMENARLLLASNRQQPAGIGNQHDLVGRFFMDRPILSGTLLPDRPELLEQTALYDIYHTKGVPVMARVHLSEDLMRQERLLNNGAQLFPRPLPHQREATLALRAAIAAVRERQPIGDGLQLVKTALRGSDYILVAGFWAAIRQLPPLRRGDWSYLPYEKQRFSQFEVFSQIEQAPDPSNRVMLSTKRDRLGQPQVELHWRLKPIDIDSALRVQAIWAEEFDKSGLGELQFGRSPAEWQVEKPAMHHHIGATRMHVDPQQGVVDANCQVHGIANLFIAGSSVFPTSGYANPTLTIVALAIRLADHIKTQMQ